VCARGDAPKGKTPVVLANANRSKLSVISTVTNKRQGPDWLHEAARAWTGEENLSYFGHSARASLEGGQEVT